MTETENAAPVAEPTTEQQTGTEISKVEADIIKQIEYYFGDANLARDKFLQGEITKDEGWVPLSVLLTFKRLAALSTDENVIVDAIEKSDEGLIEVNEDRKKIRRHPERPLPELNEEHRKEVISRTAYVKGFPPNDGTSMSDLIAFFEPYEKITNIVMRKYLDKPSKKYLFKGSVFVTFQNKELCAEFLAQESLKYKEKEMIKKWQEKYIEDKKEERAERDKKKVSKQQKPKIELPKGTILSLKGIGQTTSRESIRAALTSLGAEVAHVDFSKGQKECFVRLQTADSAKEFLKKCEGGKVKVDDIEVEIGTLVGDEEKEYLETAIEFMTQRRSQFNKGGKKNFNRKRKRDDNNEEEPAAKIAATEENVPVPADA